MSNSFINETNCVDVLHSVLLFVDGEISDTSEIATIEVHLQQCLACTAELEHERNVRSLMQSVLRRSCNESAPQELHELIHQQLLSSTMNSAPDIVREFRMTEISIEINEDGSIESHEIHIEHTEEYRFPNEEG
jgi:mycothiol system anti-sigma-R factor